MCGYTILNYPLQGPSNSETHRFFLPLHTSVSQRAVNSRCSSFPSRPNPSTLLPFRLAISIAFSTALAVLSYSHTAFWSHFSLSPSGLGRLFRLSRTTPLHAELSFGYRSLARSRVYRVIRVVPDIEALHCRESLSMQRLQVNSIVTARVTGVARRELTCNYCLVTASLPSLKLHQRRCTEAYSPSTATAVMRLGISDSISEATSN